MKKFFLFALISLGCIGTTKSQTIVTFYTNMGSFEVFLYDTLKPITAGNFKTLVENEYYDGIIFHRIISNFVIQGGDPTGSGSGGPGYTIPDEFDSSLSNIEKTLSMANSGPNTGGSQFFINTKNNTFLDFDKNPLTSAHPVFGIVISGWDTVEMIEAVAVNGNNRPLNDVIMDSIRVNAPPVGVKNLPKTTHISKVYPNPITNESVLSIHSTSSSQTRITLFNQSGNQLSSINRNLTTGKNSIHLGDLLPKGLAAGVYYLAIANGVEVVQERIVVL